jgi:hypothetical protein
MNHHCAKDVVRWERISLWRFHEPVETGIQEPEELDSRSTDCHPYEKTRMYIITGVN